MPLPRYRLRTLMLAVAAVAVFGAAARMAVLRSRYLTIARWRADDAAEARHLARFWDDQAERAAAEGWGSAEGIAFDRAQAASARARAAWNARVSRNYERAAYHPWQSVGPDPPMPE
jgi:hypothetical protein